MPARRRNEDLTEAAPDAESKGMAAVESEATGKDQGDALAAGKDKAEAKTEATAGVKDMAEAANIEAETEVAKTEAERACPIKCQPECKKDCKKGRPGSRRKEVLTEVTAAEALAEVTKTEAEMQWSLPADFDRAKIGDASLAQTFGVSVDRPLATPASGGANAEVVAPGASSRMNPDLLIKLLPKEISDNMEAMKKGDCPVAGEISGLGCNLGCGCKFYQSCHKKDIALTQDIDDIKMMVLGLCKIPVWLLILVPLLIFMIVGGVVWKLRRRKRL